VFQVVETYGNVVDAELSFVGMGGLRILFLILIMKYRHHPKETIYSVPFF
jgi:hypothetical protein